MFGIETLGHKIRELGETRMGNYPRSKSNDRGLSLESDRLANSPGGLSDTDTRRLERRWYGERQLTLRSFLRLWRMRFHTFSSRLTASSPDKDPA